MDCLTDIERVVRELKRERDTWQMLALQYKSAFESQTNRLRELQDLCVAVQAGFEESEYAQTRSACPWSPVGVDSHDPSTQTHRYPPFHHVQQFIEHREHDIALAEMLHSPPGPITTETRVRRLFLKINHFQAMGFEELYEMPAASSEVLANDLPLAELENLLLQIQYQRRVLCEQLRMIYRANRATTLFRNSEERSGLGGDYTASPAHDALVSKRRSGFDEERTMSEELMAELTQRIDVGLLPIAITNAEKA